MKCHYIEEIGYVKKIHLDVLMSNKIFTFSIFFLSFQAYINHLSNIDNGFNFMCAFEQKNNHRILNIYSEILSSLLISSIEYRTIKKCYMAEMGKRQFKTVIRCFKGKIQPTFLYLVGKVCKSMEHFPIYAAYLLHILHFSNTFPFHDFYKYWQEGIFLLGMQKEILVFFYHCRNLSESLEISANQSNIFRKLLYM